MDSALNITLDTTKDDLAVEIAGIITKLDEDCTAVPCSFTADIKTAADEMLDANWTSLHAMKNAENVHFAIVLSSKPFSISTPI